MINKAVILEFFKYGIPISAFVIIVKKYGENSTIPLYQMILVSLIVSFLLSYYRQSFKPRRLAKETIRTLNGLEELGFEFREGAYVGQFRNRDISVSYHRGRIDRYPAMLISMNCQPQYWDSLKEELKDSLKTNYRFESDVITIDHEVDDMRTFLSETKNQIARMVSIIESTEQQKKES